MAEIFINYRTGDETYAALLLDDRDADGRRRIDDPGDFVRQEIELGLRTGIRVIPVLVGQAPEPKGADLPAGIAALAS